MSPNDRPRLHSPNVVDSNASWSLWGDALGVSKVFYFVWTKQPPCESWCDVIATLWCGHSLQVATLALAGCGQSHAWARLSAQVPAWGPVNGMSDHTPRRTAIRVWNPLDMDTLNRDAPEWLIMLMRPDARKGVRPEMCSVQLQLTSPPETVAALLHQRHGPQAAPTHAYISAGTLRTIRYQC